MKTETSVKQVQEHQSDCDLTSPFSPMISHKQELGCNVSSFGLNFAFISIDYVVSHTSVTLVTKTKKYKVSLLSVLKLT